VTDTHRRSGKPAGVLLQIGHEDFKVRRHDLNDVDVSVDDLVHEALRVQDCLLLDEQRPPADQQRGNQLPQRDVEALRRRLGHHVALADPEIVNLGEEVVEHPCVVRTSRPWAPRWSQR